MREEQFIALMLLMGTIVWIVWLAVSNNRRREATRAIVEMNNRLIDKIGNSQDLAAYLDKTVDRRLIEVILSDPPGPAARIVASARIGIVLTSFGTAVLLLRTWGPLSRDQFVVSFGALGLGFGVGFLLTAFVTYWLSKRLDLISPRDESSSSK
jgi:hypothetical protein